ncbi:MAG: M28 family peptidase, partial [Acidobacteriota bacterium]
LITCLAALASAADFSGDSAFAFTQKAVGFGPRPSGSDAIKQLQAYILDQLKTCKCQITQDDFMARTPKGQIPMKNIIAKFPGRPGATTRAIAVTGHYDTKPFTGRKFVGASDGGSSTGLLLELARALAGEARTDDLYVVFFDGEEATGDWTDTDKLYGSRHLALKWMTDGTLQRLKALINVDMIGDKQLNIKQEQNSNARVRQLVWGVAKDLGYAGSFVQDFINIDDDHMPFVELGAPAIDLIDFDYAPWHEDSDTMDKLSAQSLHIVGRVVLESVRRLERQ